MKWRLTLALLAAIGLTAALAVRAQQGQDRFPHAQHTGLFPLCEGCHEGIPQDDRADFYPEPASCASCHNGVDEPRVTWAAPPPRETNLEFSHVVHERSARGAGDEIECSGCHTQAGANRMDVRRRTEPDRCFACHAHRATSHYVDAECEQCHSPLAENTLSFDRVAGFAAPPSHQDPRFLEDGHGQLAAAEPQRCSVCHTRETCASCHVDIATRSELQRIPAAQRGRNLPVPAARYFVPASHRDPDWLQEHGGEASADVAVCASCHTRESCTTCHEGRSLPPIAALPQRTDVTAPGVSVVLRAPPSHETPFFERAHGPLAAARSQTCAQCHARTECESCHKSAEAGTGGDAAPSIYSHTSRAAPADTVAARRTTRSDRAEFHPENYLERHASNSWGRQLDCQNCHDTAAFCRACHEERGMSAVGRLGGGFHDAQPNWLLNHGRAARQGLESCASCHTQRNCTQCHSETGAFRVNPHGPGFDAERMIARNPRVCFSCHLSDPTRRGG